MSSGNDGRELAEGYLGGLLESLGLGVHYSRAERDALFYRDAAGAEVAVLDLVGGYGSTIVGHNHPEIVRYAKQLLDQGVPVHAQFSRHPYANDLAGRLNTILHREFGTTEAYSALFANSGAEAVEIAMKHAEFDRVAKLTALTAEIGRGVEAARAAIDRGAVVAVDEAYHRLGVAAGVSPGAAPEAVVAAIVRVNGERATAAPIFLAPEGSFHGKLVGSVQLTHNAGFREPFRSMAAQCRFVPVHEPEALAKAVESARTTLFDLVVAAGGVRVVERDLPVIAAFILEPVQGEAGIRPFDRETAQRIQRVCAAVDCPIIVDEVQSGMGRTGAFFASSHLGLRGDYYTLAKSLGGGLAKAALTLIRDSRYHREFELAHSSTFAKDAFSTLIAGRVVDLLEADDGALYRLAAERGERLTAMLRTLQDEFGTVVEDVRGAGLMIGLEFRDRSDSPSGIIAEQSRAGLLGYLLSGYLLRVHAIRVLPTASATNTLRIEPSVYVTDDDIALLEKGLRGLLVVLREHDGAALLPAA
ncbi:aminotransferase class III-fold pyridoxal phosphate-dependent enzyme [Actinosynnema sp. NPDC047251]|uniref:Aminotransferase n=1 Tax=Saccharothrix espanaensis (strain ATCC 51144 / DSM 44229 / JCM 9112 / NBRC 15066 / NRRL 15764) TaxID=1179773 RepID=K0K566_SACES|nr:aminotransferase class III-fold pyridoxal phosphate-dependent enzyme [Saccharothrix espanaensis]CCH32004.1 Aminotransferase [Saccharothrix espanaensis DSM 44229]